MADREKTFSFGGCTFSRTSPPLEGLAATTRVLNVLIPFEEALKLSVAMQTCVLELNQKNRSTREGKRTAMNLAIHLDKGRVVVVRYPRPKSAPHGATHANT
jgi:hypothetical protein